MAEVTANIKDATMSRAENVLDRLKTAIDKVTPAQRKITPAQRKMVRVVEVTPPGTIECFRIGLANDETVWMWWPLTKAWIEMKTPMLPELPQGDSK